jgi:hypothetical protein
MASAIGAAIVHDLFMCFLLIYEPASARFETTALTEAASPARSGESTIPIETQRRLGAALAFAGGLRMKTSKSNRQGTTLIDMPSSMIAA